MPDLTIIVPSKGRPKAVSALAAAFVETCTADTRLLVALDDDDPTLDSYTGDYPRYVGRHANMVEAVNAAAAAVGSFAVGFMGDDHRPRTKGWDRRYLDALRQMGTGIVYGDDLLRGPELPTQCAMSVDIVKTLGFMCPPGLRHMYVDNFWRDLGRAAGCLRYLPAVVVEHVHPTAGKVGWDAGHLRVNHPSVYEHDEAVYTGYLRSTFGADVDKVRMLIRPREHRLFDGETPYVSTLEFHTGRPRAPHLEQPEHRPRLEMAARLVRETGASSVSDLGCGDGGLLSLLDVDAWGYDFAPANVPGWAERGVRAEALDVFGADRGRVRFGDVTVLTEVLEHVADPRGVLRWVASRFVVASSPRFETVTHHADEHAWAWNEAGFAKLFADTGWRVLRHEMCGTTQLVLAERP